MSMKHLRAIEEEADKLAKEAREIETLIDRLKYRLKSKMPLARYYGDCVGKNPTYRNGMEEAEIAALEEVIDEAGPDLLRLAILRRMPKARELRAREAAKRAVVEASISVIQEEEPQG